MKYDVAHLLLFSTLLHDLGGNNSKETDAKMLES